LGKLFFSKCGRDRGLALVVLSVCGEYAAVADGDLRRLSNPKKKKMKHLQPTNTVVNLSYVRGLQDADIRKLLKLHCGRASDEPPDDEIPHDDKSHKGNSHNEGKEVGCVGKGRCC